MSTIRYFSGIRETRKRGPAAEQMMFEIQKKGKLPTADRYKRLMQKKLQENREKLGVPQKKGFSFSNKIYDPKKLSARAERALKEIAAKKAAKLAKAERQMVIVTPRKYTNGSINKKGKIYDIAGNVVAQVNLKNGKMATNLGTALGKYKPKSYMTDLNIQNAITMHSPYFIQQRKLQQMQQNADGLVHGAITPDAINLYGYAHSTPDNNAATYDNAYGANPIGPRQNIGITAWGAMSDNVFGTFADNAWGTSSDNVWGTNSTDVWGGIGVGGLWGVKGAKIWGTGNNVNYLKNITNAILALFGIRNKATSEKLNAFRSVSRGSGNASRSAATTRAPSAPTRSK